MTDVELIIKIPEEIYKASQILDCKYEDVIQIPLEVIANSTPLSKGKWIKGSTEQGALGIRYAEKTCSKCGWSHSLIIPQNYCPNCGAEMESE